MTKTMAIRKQFMSSNKLLIIITSALFIFCLLEFAILLKDRGRFASLLTRAKASVKERGAFATAARCFLYVPRKIKRKLFAKAASAGEVSSKPCVESCAVANDGGNQITVAFLFEGGYGDYLICANFFDYFRKKFGAENVFFYLYGTGGLKDIFNYEIPNVSIYDRNECDFSFLKYDAAFKIAKRNQLMRANKERVKRFAPSLYEYLLLCEKYMAQNKLLFDMNPYLDGMQSALSVAQRKKRIQEADIYGFLGVTEDFKFNLLIKENESEYLNLLGLESKKFILVHRGWDAAYKEAEHVKAWSLKSCGDIIPRLKKKFPDYKVILFGVDRQQAPAADGADINLISKTTLNQAKVLLKHAAVLIDNEGGMVHLRHALRGGASVVLFGPTSKALFGYSENANISSNFCAQPCEWLSADWQYRCALTGERGHPCMDAITTDDVLQAVEKVLARLCS